MTLIEVLKRVSVENLDTEELIFDGNCDGEEQENYEFFVHNLKALSTSKDWEKMNSLEINEDVLADLRDNGGNINDWDDDITALLLNAAWLTYNGIDYAERKEKDKYDDLCDYAYNYEFCFADFDFSFEYEGDIDLL